MAPKNQSTKVVIDAAAAAAVSPPTARQDNSPGTPDARASVRGNGGGDDAPLVVSSVSSPEVPVPVAAPAPALSSSSSSSASAPSSAASLSPVPAPIVSSSSAAAATGTGNRAGTGTGARWMSAPEQARLRYVHMRAAASYIGVLKSPFFPQDGAAYLSHLASAKARELEKMKAKLEAAKKLSKDAASSKAKSKSKLGSGSSSRWALLPVVGVSGGLASLWVPLYHGSDSSELSLSLIELDNDKSMVEGGVMKNDDHEGGGKGKEGKAVSAVAAASSTEEAVAAAAAGTEPASSSAFTGAFNTTNTPSDIPFDTTSAPAGNRGSTIRGGFTPLPPTPSSPVPPAPHLAPLLKGKTNLTEDFLSVVLAKPNPFNGFWTVKSPDSNDATSHGPEAVPFPTAAEYTHEASRPSISIRNSSQVSPGQPSLSSSARGGAGGSSNVRVVGKRKNKKMKKQKQKQKQQQQQQQKQKWKKKGEKSKDVSKLSPDSAVVPSVSGVRGGGPPSRSWPLPRWQGHLNRNGDAGHTQNQHIEYMDEGYVRHLWSEKLEPHQQFARLRKAGLVGVADAHGAGHMMREPMDESGIEGLRNPPTNRTRELELMVGAAEAQWLRLLILHLLIAVSPLRWQMNQLALPRRQWLMPSPLPPSPQKPNRLCRGPWPPTLPSLCPCPPPVYIVKGICSLLRVNVVKGIRSLLLPRSSLRLLWLLSPLLLPSPSSPSRCCCRLRWTRLCLRWFASHRMTRTTSPSSNNNSPEKSFCRVRILAASIPGRITVVTTLVRSGTRGRHPILVTSATATSRCPYRCLVVTVFLPLLLLPPAPLPACRLLRPAPHPGATPKLPLPLPVPPRERRRRRRLLPLPLPLSTPAAPTSRRTSRRLVKLLPLPAPSPTSKLDAGNPPVVVDDVLEQDIYAASPVLVPSSAVFASVVDVVGGESTGNSTAGVTSETRGRIKCAVSCEVGGAGDDAGDGDDTISSGASEVVGGDTKQTQTQTQASPAQPQLPPFGPGPGQDDNDNPFPSVYSAEEQQLLLQTYAPARPGPAPVLGSAFFPGPGPASGIFPGGGLPGTPFFAPAGPGLASFSGPAAPVGSGAFYPAGTPYPHLYPDFAPGFELGMGMGMGMGMTMLHPAHGQYGPPVFLPAPPSPYPHGYGYHHQPPPQLQHAQQPGHSQPLFRARGERRVRFADVNMVFRLPSSPGGIVDVVSVPQSRPDDGTGGNCAVAGVFVGAGAAGGGNPGFGSGFGSGFESLSGGSGLEEEEARRSAGTPFPRGDAGSLGAGSFGAGSFGAGTFAAGTGFSGFGAGSSSGPGFESHSASGPGFNSLPLSASGFDSHNNNAPAFNQPQAANTEPLPAPYNSFRLSSLRSFERTWLESSAQFASAFAGLAASFASAASAAFDFPVAPAAQANPQQYQQQPAAPGFNPGYYHGHHHTPSAAGPSPSSTPPRSRIAPPVSWEILETVDVWDLVEDLGEAGVVEREAEAWQLRAPVGERTWDLHSGEEQSLGLGLGLGLGDEGEVQEIGLEEVPVVVRELVEGIDEFDD
ncbi:unnamed protein product [Sordaria macrospora k-hell]|uniref:WGS project CABT00000000 data, contig 2.3 n=1 Tax=Sordaria macrospora (strain ATCC MYA-333 / DSM 997 / K(L3346) / K-hell) TaxID=771870 RepID=F7VNY7_SORMK|nr:uncharacterized protein SMAC_06268 [Sordaria macrospora k-hell]CCC07214.1 unnamed protein product [Sordaria macrospora k-hell]